GGGGFLRPLLTSDMGRKALNSDFGKLGLLARGYARSTYRNDPAAFRSTFFSGWAKNATIGAGGNAVGTIGLNFATGNDWNANLAPSSGFGAVLGVAGGGVQNHLAKLPAWLENRQKRGIAADTAYLMRRLHNTP